MMPRLNYTLIAAVFSVILFSCNKPDQRSPLKIHLTDAPGDYDQVNVNIQEVQIKTTATASWQILPTNQGMYDLIQLQNGVDTLLANGYVNGETLQEIRLILGSGNTVMVDSILYDMNVPSGAQTGLKIKVHQPLMESINTIIVDFDAGLSVHKTGTGIYQLKPVLQIKP